MSMQMNSMLIPDYIKSQSREVITKLQNHTTELNNLKNSFSTFEENQSIKGVAAVSISLMMSDYSLVIDGMISANDADIEDHNTLISNVGFEKLNGSVIAARDTATTSMNAAQDKADYWNHLAYLMESGNSMTGEIISSFLLEKGSGYARLKARGYQKTADDCSNVITECNRQIEAFDTIESSTCNLFFVGNSLRETVKTAIQAIRGAVTGSTYIPPNGEWRDKLMNIDREIDELRELQASKGTDVPTTIYGGDPINLASGNFTFDREYLKVKGLFPLFFKLSYNSVALEDSTCGIGFSHNYQTRLIIENEQLSLCSDHGKRDYFIKNDDGVFRAKRSQKSYIVKDDHGYTHVTLNTTYRFDLVGKIISIHDINQNVISFDYDLLSHLLIRVTSNSESFLQFTHNPARKLTRVEDNQGRYITLQYENKKLCSINDEEGNTFHYSYDEYNRISSVKNPRMVNSLINTFDKNGRVLEQRFPDGGVVTLDYDDNEKKITMTAQNGGQTEYYHDERFRNTIIKDANGAVRYFYNEFNQRLKYVDRKGNTTKYSYDEKGNIICITNPLNQTIETEFDERNKPVKLSLSGQLLYQNQYDDRGNLLSRRNALGNETRLIYHSNGRPVTIQQADDSEINLQYDRCGNITKIINPTGAEYQYEYDNVGNVSATIDGNGNRTTYSYNKRGSIIAVTDAFGHAREYDYDASGNVVSLKDFDGERIATEYNVVNKPSRITDKNGNTFSYEYDKMWNLVCQTAPDGQKTKYIHDVNNRLTEVVYPDGSSYRYEYDANGNKTKRIAPDGSEMIYDYDEVNRVRRITGIDGIQVEYEYNIFGKTSKKINGVGRVREYVYNPAGQKILELSNGKKTAQFKYNSLGKLIEKTDFAGRVTKYEYISGGILSRIFYPNQTSVAYSYDANGNIASKEMQDGHRIQYEYDALNRVMKSESNTGAVEIYTYTPLGQVASVEDSYGNITRYTYSPMGDLIVVTDAKGNTSRYEYDALHKLTDIYQMDEDYIESSSENSDHVRHMSYLRDNMGRVIRTKDALGKEETMTYDIMGRVVTKTDKDDMVTEFQYNKSGKVSQITYADGNVVKCTYNALRQLTAIEDCLGITKYEADPSGREKRVIDHNGSVITYLYDDFGKRSKMIYPDGKEVSYEYDELLRIKKLSSDIGDIQYQYGDTGKLTSKAFGPNVHVDYEYNKVGRLTRVTNYDETGILDDFAYEYDLNGNKTQITKNRRDLPEDSGTFQYTYDALNRLTGSYMDGDLLREYGYDAFGNRSFMREDDGTTEYQYDLDNKLMYEQCMDNMISYGYDNRGNLSEIIENNTLQKSFIYGANGKLSSVQTADGNVTKYIYDGFGNKIKEQVFTPLISSDPVEEISYVIEHNNSNKRILQILENGNTKDYFWDRHLIGEVNSKTSSMFLPDELGSLLREINTEGKTSGSASYDEFGLATKNGNMSSQPFGFTGYSWDKHSGTYYAQARQYMPGAARFAGKDIVKGTVFSPRTLNEYVYCWNMPLTYVDKDGRFPSIEIPDIGELWETGSEWVSDVAEDVGDFVEDAEDWVSDRAEDVDDFVEDAEEWVSDRAEDVQSIAEDPWGAWNQANDVVTDLVVENIDNIAPIVNDVFEVGFDVYSSMPEGAQDIVRNGFTWALRNGRDIAEFDLFGPSISDSWYEFCTNPENKFLEQWDFQYDEEGGFYYTTTNCWQRAFGYNDFYDAVFNGFTSMDVNKFTFTSGNEDYALWLWKGDYYNLGAGAETGIYVGDGSHMECATDTSLQMTLSVYDVNGELILNYTPEEYQWWITGFNPDHPDMNANDLLVVTTIDFSEEPDLWEAFLEQYEKNIEDDKAYLNEGWCIDEDKKTATCRW